MNKNKGLKILTLSLAVSGLLATTSGLVLNKMDVKEGETKVKVQVIEKQVAKIKTNIPILKDITVEINEPISVDVKTYISNLEDISDDALKQFKLDTSLVNVTNPGKYTYIISYKSKKYSGNVIVKEKSLPNLEIKLKNLELKLNSTLPQDVTFYIENTVPDEAIQTMKLDLSQVNTGKAGEYQYKITYNNQQYTGKIKIYEEMGTQNIKYTLKYICGTKEEKIVRTQESKSNRVSLQMSEIVKPESFTECTSEIDKTKTTISFPISIGNNDEFTIYFKTIEVNNEE